MTCTNKKRLSAVLASVVSFYVLPLSLILAADIILHLIILIGHLHKQIFVLCKLVMISLMSQL